jgi:DNA-binding response OmpR family regulator
MPSDFVVVVDADLSAYGALVEGLPADVLDVVSVATARAGFNVACALEPNVIVAALDLPDADALELVSVIRGHDTRVAYTPLIVLTATDDEATRLSVLHSGADLVLSAPIDPVELVAQVNAMLAMDQRIRELERGQSVLPPASNGQAYAVLGDPQQMSVASVLGALELEKRSGVLSFGGWEPRKLRIHIASGVLVGGELDGTLVPALAALKVALTWGGNQFGFVAGEDVPAPPDAKPLGSLLLAAFAESEPNERLVHEMEASRRLLGDTAAGLSLAESLASFRLGETASGLRLEETAAGRRFLRDTAAGIRLTSTQRMAEEAAVGLRSTPSASLRQTGAGKAKSELRQTGGSKVLLPPPLPAAPLTGTLASFGQDPPAPIPPPVPPAQAEEPPASQRTGMRIRPRVTPELVREKAAMRRTLRGLETAEVIPGAPEPPSLTGTERMS